jgi:transposase-like protein
MSLYLYRHVIANERTCYWFLHRLRWPQEVQCPRCQSVKFWRMAEKGHPEYRCSSCRLHFSLLTGTVLANTKLPLTKWVLAVALLNIGLSALALARELRVSYHVAWRMAQIIRGALGRKNGLLTKLRGSIEMDDAFFGGRRKGKRGRGAAHKTIVLGLWTRRGHLRTLVVPNLKTNVVRQILETHVAKGARLYTDKFRGYNKIRRWDYRHRRLNHSKQFARGKTHTQGIEGVWGRVKPLLTARHRSIDPKYLQRYLWEVDYKHNLSKEVDFTREVLSLLLKAG